MALNLIRHKSCNNLGKMCLCREHKKLSEKWLQNISYTSKLEDVVRPA